MGKGDKIRWSRRRNKMKWKKKKLNGVKEEKEEKSEKEKRWIRKDKGK